MIEIRDHFRSIARVLAAQAQVAGATQHAATTGSAREQVLHRFLRPHLPSTLTLKSGVIIDADGKRSRQQDCVILDARLPLIDIGSATDAVLLAESVIATVEIKSILSRAELQSTLESGVVTKSLCRKGEQEYHKGPAQIRIPVPLPIYTYVFAFAGARLDTLAACLLEFARERKDPHCLPGAVCVLDQGVVLCPHFMPTVRGTDVILPALDKPKMTISPYRHDALMAFYRRLIDDIIPLRLVNYDFDAYYHSDSLE